MNAIDLLRQVLLNYPYFLLLLLTSVIVSVVAWFKCDFLPKKWDGTDHSADSEDHLNDAF